MSTLNNLAITTTNRLMTTAIGRAFDTLQSIIANGGRDSNCKFYHNNGAGGSVLQVVAKSVVGGAVSDIKNVAVNHFNSWLNGKDEPKQIGTAWVEAGVKRKEAEEKVYGKMLVNDGKETVYALDDWGCICPDSLMLGIKVDKPKYKVYAAFGTDLTEAIAKQKTDTIDAEIAYPESFRVREFDTQTEADAYIKGLDDACGWMENCVLNPKNPFESKIIDKINKR